MNSDRCVIEAALARGRAVRKWKQRGFLLNPFRFGPAGDPELASVLLGENHQGTNGSTTFTDFSPVGRTLTAQGNAQISTAQFLYGDSSALFDGAGDYVLLGTNIGREPNEAWCYEQVFRPDESSYSGGSSTLRGLIVDVNTGGNDYVGRAFYYNADASAARGLFGFNDNQTTIMRSTALLTAATWHFAQIVNDPVANTCTLYLDGTQEAQVTERGFRMSVYGTSYSGGSPTLYYDGHLGQLRVTAATRANAVPTALFPES